jgi:AraC-like DNA-binding protein
MFFRYAELTMSRSPRMIRQGDPEMYELAIPLAGDSVLVQERRHCVVRPTEFAFFTTSRPFECRHIPQQERPPATARRPVPPPTAGTVAIIFPQSAIPLPQNKINRMLAGRLPAEGMGSLLSQLLRQVGQHPEQFRPADSRQLGGMALDLVAAMLAEQLDLEEALPTQVRQEALRARIDAFITDNLGDVDLTASSIAAAHHISLRTLYRLWEGEETSVAGLIRRRRLERCRRDLANPLLTGQPAYAIAARWGFTDKASFSRAFRASYGMSPQEYRQQPAPS